MSLRANNAKKLHDLYEKDAFQWYNENAKLLREKKFELIDVENLAEEIESMGRGERSKLESYLTQLFLHLLKWKYQPNRRGSSWEISIKKQRRHIQDHLSENPSLKGHIASICEKAYYYSKLDAMEETGLSLETFPDKLPFSNEEILQDDWLPSE